MSLTEIDAQVLEASVGRIQANLRSMTQLGLIDPAAAAAAPDRIQTTAELAAAVEQADVVIEAASENLSLKQRCCRNRTPRADWRHSRQQQLLVHAQRSRVKSAAAQPRGRGALLQPASPSAHRGDRAWAGDGRGGCGNEA
jgi:hypothetical protein